MRSEARGSPPVEGRRNGKYARQERRRLCQTEVGNSKSWLRSISIKNWSPLDGLDSVGSSCQHNETVEAKRSAASVRHISERCEEILVDGIGRAENALLFLHGSHEPPPLFMRVAQFVESVSQFNPATVQFEALGNSWIIWAHLRKRGLACRIGMENSRPP